MEKLSVRGKELVEVSLGQRPAEKIIGNGKLVNVFTSEIYRADLAIWKDRIAAVGDVQRCRGANTEIIDARGQYLVPGLIDPHLHFYHACMNVTNFAKASLIHGTTAIADGFYAQGIVGGIKAIRLMLEAFKRTPLKLLFVVASHAYLQNRDLGIDPTPSAVTAEELLEMLEWPETIGVEEPPARSIIDKNELYLRLFQRALERNLVIHGHAAEVPIPGLNAYIAAGAATDHESVEAADAVHKARLGIKILMRQASGSFNVRELTKAITEYGLSPRAFAFCTDIAAPIKLYKEGLIDECIRVAIRSGIEPVTAIQMGTLNAAESCNQQANLGSLGPGKIADVLFVEDLRDFVISRVLANGSMVVEKGKYIGSIEPPKNPDFVYDTIKLKRPLTPEDFKIRAPKPGTTAAVRVIVAFEQTIISQVEVAKLSVVDGVLQPDAARDILLISMIDRHGGNGQVGNGFVKGFKLKKGAIATSLNALCENIMIVGTNANDMSIAANRIAELRGGIVVVAEGKVTAEVALPLLGLMSEEPLESFLKDFEKVSLETRKLGCEFDSPYATIEFIGANGEIGRVKIFEGGLIDVDKSARISVFEG